MSFASEEGDEGFPQMNLPPKEKMRILLMSFDTEESEKKGRF